MDEIKLVVSEVYGFEKRDKSVLIVSIWNPNSQKSSAKRKSIEYEKITPVQVEFLPLRPWWEIASL